MTMHQAQTAAPEAATPRPWRVGPSHVVQRQWQDDQGRRCTSWIAECVGDHPPGEIEANASLIVRACNSHDELVEAGLELSDIAGEGSEDLPDDTMVRVCIGERSVVLCRLHQFRALTAAIARATGAA